MEMSPNSCGIAAAQPQMCVCVNGIQLESCGHVNKICIMLQGWQRSSNCGGFVCDAPPKFGSKLIRPLHCFRLAPCQPCSDTEMLLAVCTSDFGKLQC